MTESEAREAVRQHFEGLFPRTCPSCGRQFATLREYMLTTKRVGMAMSLDAEEKNWRTTQPIGSLALANCPCGSTLALSTQGMALPRRLELLSWVRMETQRRGISPSEVLESLRDDIRKQVLGEPTP